MTEAHGISIEFIGTDDARALAEHAYTVCHHALTKGSLPHPAACRLWEGLSPFATPEQVSIVDALTVENADEYGLTGPEVVMLPLEAQQALKDLRERTHVARNQTQRAYELRTGVEGLFTAARREQARAEALEAELASRAAELDVKVEVLRSAELLDRQLPGWASLIDVADLAMSTFDRCILGQLAGRHPAVSDLREFHQVWEWLLRQEGLTAKALSFGGGTVDWVKLIGIRVHEAATSAQ